FPMRHVVDEARDLLLLRTEGEGDALPVGQRRVHPRAFAVGQIVAEGLPAGDRQIALEREVANREAPAEAEGGILRAVERVVLAREVERMAAEHDRGVEVGALVGGRLGNRGYLNDGPRLRDSAGDVGCGEPQL